MRLDLQDESYTQLQQPIKKTFCESLRRDTHWKCLILTLLIYGCLVAIAWCRLTTVEHTMGAAYDFHRQTSRASPCEDGYVYIPVAFVVMLYLVYLVECWHCHTRIQLQYKVDVNTVYDRVQQMRESLPIVWWKAVCYHYVRRSRQVTRYRNGDTFTTTQVYYERVNSHTASSAFNFTNCGIKDVSKTLVNLEKFPATKIKFSKGFSFTTSEAEREFEEQRNDFFAEHERRDDYMETREGLDLMNTNFKEHAIAFADPDNLPWYVSQAVFWLASLCLLSWPLRVLIEYKTAYVRYHVHKLFGCNYLDSTFTPGPISRVSTLASMELEMNIRNNYSMVPSYSEALLMDSNTVADENRNATPTAIYHNGYAPIQGNVCPTGNTSSIGDTTNERHRTQSCSPISRCSGANVSIPSGASSRRNVILRLPSSISARLKRKYSKTKNRPHSFAEIEPLMGRSAECSPQPRRSLSMHSTPTACASDIPPVITSTSSPNVIPSISSESYSAMEINQNHARQNPLVSVHRRVTQVTGNGTVSQPAVASTCAQSGVSTSAEICSVHGVIHQPRDSVSFSQNNLSCQPSTSHANSISQKKQCRGPVPCVLKVVPKVHNPYTCDVHINTAAEGCTAHGSHEAVLKSQTQSYSVQFSKSKPVPSAHRGHLDRDYTVPTHGCPTSSDLFPMRSIPAQAITQSVRDQTGQSREQSVTPESPPSYESALFMTVPASPVCLIQPAAFPPFHMKGPVRIYGVQPTMRAELRESDINSDTTMQTDVDDDDDDVSLIRMMETTL